ncbi:uncharacterized protein QC761_108205 [Podospora bellae-mahoneyi]|uniref:Uncharacterized protein n=1 Tax=Podospora bellae-mahoneyi TaxID=2093777 RepID=A0ABR0FWZ0_9PEZI|nr:hypothetical protein QC761_108205 [Podospora bellae-mahoneyi]
MNEHLGLPEITDKITLRSVGYMKRGCRTFELLVDMSSLHLQLHMQLRSSSFLPLAAIASSWKCKSD